MGRKEWLCNIVVTYLVTSLGYLVSVSVLMFFSVKWVQRPLHPVVVRIIQTIS